MVVQQAILRLGNCKLPHSIIWSPPSFLIVKPKQQIKTQYLSIHYHDLDVKEGISIFPVKLDDSNSTAFEGVAVYSKYV